MVIYEVVLWVCPQASWDGKFYPKSSKGDRYLKALETLVFSEVRAYEILRDRIQVIRDNPLSLAMFKPDKTGKCKAGLFMNAFNSGWLRQSKELNAFMISPEPSTLRGLKKILRRCDSGNKQFYPLFSMEIRKRIVNP